MLVLGLILLLLAVGALVSVLLSRTNDQTALYGGSVHLPTFVVFLAGAVAMLFFLVGLRFARLGLGRELRRRKDARRLRTLEQREAERRGADKDPASEESDSEEHRRGETSESDT